MSWQKRINIYQRIESHRKRPLIVYVTSKRYGAWAEMGSDALPSIIEQLDALSVELPALDFMIVSIGGDPMTAWRIMSLIRARLTKEGAVSVLIPQSAYSAATLLAFGANEIVMHPNGHLGPVDMQITSWGESGPRRYSTEDISAFLEFVREKLKITDQEHLRVLFEGTCKEVGTTGIGFMARSSKLAIDLGERLLALHMKDDDTRSKLRTIVENMSRKFQTHGYPVNRTEALEIGLPVNKERDLDLEKMMWEVWLDIEEDLKENIQFHPLFELLNSNEAKKLLSPVPQLLVPMVYSSGGHVSTNVDDLIQKSKPVKPVDFEYVSAIVESSRAASQHITRGKILSCRSPNLVINYSQVAVSQAWEKVRTTATKVRKKR
jgi:Serine dehydrogenase proteinase